MGIERGRAGSAWLVCFVKKGPERELEMGGPYISSPTFGGWSMEEADNLLNCCSELLSPGTRQGI